jgi:hypothetical protein
VLNESNQFGLERFISRLDRLAAQSKIHERR